MPTYKRNSVIPFPGGEENTILMSFADEKGKLRNVTITNAGIAAQFEAHQKELDALAEEYSQKRQAIVDKRPVIEALAFAEGEKFIAKEERDRREREEQARAERENPMSPNA